MLGHTMWLLMPLHLHFGNVKPHTKHMLLTDMSPATHESWHCLSDNIQVRTLGISPQLLFLLRKNLAM